jgi:hypothetical protein
MSTEFLIWIHNERENTRSRFLLRPGDEIHVPSASFDATFRVAGDRLSITKSARTKEEAHPPYPPSTTSVLVPAYLRLGEFSIRAERLTPVAIAPPHPPRANGPGVRAVKKERFRFRDE